MISVEEALARCLALVSPLPAEEVPLREAAGRMMAAPALATRDQPPFDASAMDGYALGGDPEPGARFTVIAEAQAGHAAALALGPGEAIRIFTGAPIPQGATRVVIQEDVTREGDTITIGPKPDAARHIRPRGQDFRAGDALSPRRLSPHDLALLAAMNIPRVSVTRKPSVAILATGDELVMPGDSPGPDQIICSNAFALAALAEAEGATARILPIARDRVEELTAAFHLAAGVQGEGADLILTIGGASVGDHDLVGPVAQSLGLERAFWKIAMRPGKPLMAGRVLGRPMLGLPGNPVSSIVCAHLFLLPMLRAMQGRPDVAPEAVEAVLAEDVAPTGPRTLYMRARVAGGVITPFARQDSALIQVLTEANALLIRPKEDVARQKGDRVFYLPL
ncbi:molybdopterin molybdotransferase MoeA [Stagnihabitans tardus]|uniref:Molybdopterin molybdenumtransferase n=1 Tax=Stagnihabitans tardus TaxID=2699202 RepID=A0AAE4YCB8_9RHOB|nr:gephyrin-like molybdotransferase Glp [Stagnihabitans tardus]NBZ88766.1 molybdopterin molybdenumtransferase MoeA [Stagnihabitans tardus]